VWWNAFKDVRALLNDVPEKHRSRLMKIASLHRCPRFDERRSRSQEFAKCIAKNTYAIHHIPWEETLP
jgi:hypothetical protein